jgi:SHS2 domain-containing protein
MTVEKYRFLEHTADLAVEIFGSSPEALLVHGGEALFAALGRCESPRCTVERSIEIEAEGLEALLHDWLAELNFLHQTQGEVYHRFKIPRLEANRLEGIAYGEAIDPERHAIDLEIKAVTWHRLEVRREGRLWRAHVILDI